MKVIIAGSREIYDPNLVRLAVEQSGFEITEVVSGCASGVDRLGEKYARCRHIDLARFPAAWRDIDGAFNPSAYLERNQRMSEYAEALIAVWREGTPGTLDMIKRAHAKGLKVFIYKVA